MTDASPPGPDPRPRAGGAVRAHDPRGAWPRLLRAAAVALVGLACALGVASQAPGDAGVDIVRLELAGSGERAVAVVDAATPEDGAAGTRADVVTRVGEHLDQDARFVVAYATALVAVLALLVVARTRAARRAPRRSRHARTGPGWTIYAGVAIAAVVVAAGLDGLENARLRAGLDRIAPVPPGDAVPPAADADFAVASFAAGTKFALLLLAIGIAATLAVVFVRSGFAPPRERPPGGLPEDVERSWAPADGKIGISCSGGGVRSATFCLGALQVLQRAGVLREARYVTAVSGGGYIAASHAIANGAPGTPPPGDPRTDQIFAPRSPEERWVRLHSSHLVASSLVLLGAALRLVVGILFGWLLIWLLLFAVARPLGWLMSSSAVHPELRARTPILETATQPQLLDAPEVTFVEENRTADPAYAVYSFVPAYTCAQMRLWETTTDSSSVPVPAALTTTGPGLVRVERGEAAIVDQPTLAIADGAAEQPTDADGDPGACTVDGGADPFAPTSPNAEGPALVVSTEAAFALDSQAFRTTPRATGGATPDDIATAIAAALDEEASPTVTHRSGMTGREPIHVGYGQWLSGLALVLAGLALYLVRLLWRPFTTSVRRTLELSSAVVSLTGAVWLAVLVALPWCVQEVPPFLGELLHVGGDKGGASGDGATGLDAVLATLGITGVLAAAVRAFGDAALKQGKAHLTLVTRAMVGVVLPLIGALVFLDLLEFATANGPTGRMLGLGIGMSVAGSPLAPDVARWCLVLVLLAALATVDAHAWSLYPFYKRRLSEAYAIARDADGTVRDVRYEAGPVLVRGVASDPSWWAQHRPRWWPRRWPPGHDDGEADARRRSHARLAPPAGEYPQLVMCCAANVSDRSVAPPGRRSVSFTVSHEAIGSELGWMDTGEYLERLGKRRLSDLTLPSLMAISGAAVSPGMGKASRGPLDSLLALLNVRLGVWLPSPAAVRERNADRPWRGLPWWGWYLREVVGRFPRSAPYLYVSDGGHWENLGLVELFRRGCTRIYCVSAAGDGPESFSTIGEALALAREEFGVTTDVDLTKLRRPATSPDPVARPFRRRAGSMADGKPADTDWAVAGHVAGSFWYADAPGVEGRIVILEANLSADIPWDVQTWAESNAAFPDDPTTDQLFSHRQFESYLALGRCQMEAGCADL